MRATTLLAAATAVALSTTVYAADKAAPPAEPVEAPYISPLTPSCYVQVLGGAGINGAKAADGTGYIESVSASGWTIAGGLGCDARMGRYVVGLLGRYELPVLQDKDLFEVQGSWLAAARAGYIINSGLMAYGLVGLSGSSWDIGNASQDTRGLVLGGGLEVMLSKHLSLTAEYTNTQYGKWTEGSLKINPESHAARLGLNYRFIGALFGE